MFPLLWKYNYLNMLGMFLSVIVSYKEAYGQSNAINAYPGQIL